MKHFPFARLLVILSVLALAGCGKSATTTSESNTSSGGSAATTGGPAGQTSGQSTSAPPSAPAPKPIVVPEGTEITVSVDQAVSSKDNNAGDHFDVSIAEPVVVGDKVVIPKGAKGVGTVTDAKSAGRFKGSAGIAVTLSSVTVEGKEYQVKATDYADSGKGRGKRTAEGAGGGAVVGALIGALAGHGKGAAIGAAAGAGAGTAGAAFTGERDVTIASETRLHFKLKEPLEIQRK